MDDFIFVSSISRWEVAHARLLASPCLQGGGERLVLQVNADSAAAAVNMVNGRVTNQAVAETFGLPYVPYSGSPL